MSSFCIASDMMECILLHPVVRSIILLSLESFGKQDQFLVAFSLLEFITVNILLL
jgi:hypothetical protein